MMTAEPGEMEAAAPHMEPPPVTLLPSLTLPTPAATRPAPMLRSGAAKGVLSGAKSLFKEDSQGLRMERSSQKPKDYLPAPNKAP